MTAIWIAVLTLAAIALIAGLALSFASGRLPASEDDLVDQVNALLPQTQCAQCGYPGCRPYAKAIATEDAAINLCPPGGDETVNRLAELLGRYGIASASVHQPAPAWTERTSCRRSMPGRPTPPDFSCR